MQLLRSFLFGSLDQLYQAKDYTLEQGPHHVGLGCGRTKTNEATC